MRLRDRRGNAMVEFALCALPLFGMFFGLSDVALAVFIKNMMQSAVRDAVRFTITYELKYKNTTCTSQTECAKVVAKEQALGFLEGKENLIEIKYYSPDNLSQPLSAGDVGPGKKLANGEDLMYMNQTGNVVEVSVVNFPWNWMVPLPGFMPSTQVKMSQYASDIFQGYPIGTAAPPAP